MGRPTSIDRGRQRGVHTQGDREGHMHIKETHTERHMQSAMERAVEEVHMSKAWRELNRQRHTIANWSIHEFTYITYIHHLVDTDRPFNLLLRHYSHTRVWSLQLSRLSHLLTGGGSPQPAPLVLSHQPAVSCSWG